MASRKHDMDMFCKSCIYDPAVPGSWRSQVEDCKSGPTAKVPCHLWVWRPITMETQLSRRKDKNSIDTLVAGLEDDDETEAV